MVVRLNDLKSDSTPNKSKLVRLDDINKQEGEKQAASFKQSEQKFGHVSANPADSQVMQQANQYSIDHPTEPTWNGVIDNPIGRTAGKALGALGTGIEKAKEITGLNHVQGAVRGLSTAAYPTHTSDGTYLGEYKSLAQNAVEGASNMVKSTVQGFLHPKEADKKFGEVVDQGLKNTNPVTRFAGKMVAEGATDPTSYIPIPVSEIVKGFKALPSTVSTALDRFASRNSPIKDFAPEVQPTLALPPASAESLAVYAKRNGNVLPTNEKPILGQGDVQTLALPESNTPRIINDIKNQATDLMKPPTARRDLIDYVGQHLQISRDEVVKLSDADLYEVGQGIRKTANMDELHAKFAADQGHNWNDLVLGKSVTGNVEAPLNRIQDIRPPTTPNLIGAKQGAETILPPAPKSNVVRLSDMRKEVAATTTLKPKVEPIKGTVTKKEAVTTPVTKVDAIGKPNSLKVNAEVQRSITPTQRVSGVRANYQNQLKNGNLSPKLKDMIKNTDQSYEKITNKASDEVAQEAVKNLSKAESDFLLNQTGGPEHIATGYRLQQKLDAMGEHARALVVSNKLAKDLTKSGQTNQAASIISRLSPEGQLLNLIRQAERNGKVVSVKDSVEFKTQAKKAQEKAGAGIQANQFTEILDRAAKGESLTTEDVKKMADYLASAEKNSTKAKVIKVVDDLPNELKEPRKRDRIVSYLDDAEKAALARIKARRGNLNSLPLAEWGDHAIVVAAQITKGSIKAATHVEDLVKLFGEEIRPVATQVFQKAQSLVKSVSPSIGLNDMTKANKAFERISGQTKEVNFQEKIVEKYLKENPKVSPKDIETLRELAKNVTQLSGNEGIKADIAMQKILNNYEKSTPWDKVKAIRYIAMLLNSGTQMVNAASGPIMATLGHTADVFGVMIDTAMHHALKTPRSTTLYGSNPLRFMADYTKNLLKVGMPSGWHGVNPAGIQNVGEIRGLTFKSNYNPLNWAERTLGAVAKGTDYATYKTIYDSEIRKAGFLEAVSSGIKRSDRAAIKSYVEKFVNEPTETAMLQADRIGKNTTFQRSDSIGGSTANFLNSGNEKVKKYVSPVVNAVIPFVKTPINIASTAVTMTPAGIIKGLYQLTSKSPASQREAIRTLSLSLTGSAGIGSLGYYLSQLGIITGSNDSGDKNVDAIKEQAGQGKYRFNTSALKRYMDAWLSGDGADAAEKAAKYQEGDHAFDYNKFQPIAFPLAIGASLGKTAGKPIVGRLEKAGGDAYGSLFGMSTLKGVQDVFQPQYSGTQGEKSIGVASRVAESFFKSFSPSMLAQEARRQDPIARKTPYNNGIKEDVKGYFKSRTPGLSESLAASKTTLGMNKQNAAGFSGQYINPYKSEIAAYSSAAVIISDLIDKTGDNSLAPSAPDKKVTGKDKHGDSVSIAIPQDRYEQLQEEVGHAIIAKIMAIPTDWTDVKKADKIKQIYSDVNTKERNKVKKELGIRVSN